MGDKYGAMIRLWRNAWSEFVPLLDYDTEIRKVVCSTNAIESLNTRYRARPGLGAISQRAGRLNPPALKCLYLVIRSLDPTGAGRTRWAMRLKPVLNAFAIAFVTADRLPRPANQLRGKHRSCQCLPWAVRRVRSTVRCRQWPVSLVRPAGCQGPAGVA
jgi:putative transposase